MQYSPFNNFGYDTVFSGCENDNDSKDVVTTYIYIYFFF